jgi:demethylspheroidene O-methyltransferase
MSVVAEPVLMPEPPLGWWARQRERLHAWADALLASQRFRDWAAAFPLTRPIARRRAGQLFDLVAGFVYSQVLAACVQLRVFELLARGPRPLDQIAAAIGLEREAARRLLDAATALRLLARRAGGRYALGPLGASLVGNEAVTAMVEHHGLLYRDLTDPVALLRGERGSGELARFWAYATTARPDGLDDERVARYSALMSASQPLVAGEILDAVDLRGRRCLLDVGGGEGTFLRAVAERHPQLQLMLFDLPAVAERGRIRLAEAGLADRASVHGGSFLADPLPAGADVVSVVRVLHDHDDGSVLALLRRIRAALPDDGLLVIAEPMADAPGAAAMGDAYFGFYLLAMGQGRARTPERLGALLAEAGFAPGRLVPTRLPIQTQILVCSPDRDVGQTKA